MITTAAPRPWPWPSPPHIDHGMLARPLRLDAPRRGGQPLSEACGPRVSYGTMDWGPEARCGHARRRLALPASSPARPPLCLLTVADNVPHATSPTPPQPANPQPLPFGSAPAMTMRGSTVPGTRGPAQVRPASGASSLDQNPKTKAQKVAPPLAKGH